MLFMLHRPTNLLSTSPLAETVLNRQLHRNAIYSGSPAFLRDGYKFVDGIPTFGLVA